MTEIHVLPYREPPPRLTATARSKTLKAHYEAFLAHHRSDQRVEIEETLQDETIGDILTFIGLEPLVSIKHMRSMARRIRMLSRGKIGYQQAIELQARALGYRTQAAMFAANPRKVVALNIRGGNEVPFSMSLFMNEKETRGDRVQRRKRTLYLRDNPGAQA